MHIRHICKYYMTLFISLSLAVLLYIRNIPFAWVVEKGFTHKTFSVWIEGEPGVSGGKKSDVCTCIFCTWNSFGMLKCVCVRERFNCICICTHIKLWAENQDEKQEGERQPKKEMIFIVTAERIIRLVPMQSLEWLIIWSRCDPSTDSMCTVCMEWIRTENGNQSAYQPFETIRLMCESKIYTLHIDSRVCVLCITLAPLMRYFMSLFLSLGYIHAHHLTK